MARRRDRTFTGCWKCRTRKVKCDETKPACLACRRIGVRCTGYDAKFIWVEDDGQIVASQGRRILPCASTWKGVEVLPSDVVDLLISECDVDGDGSVELSVDQSFSTSSWKTITHNPFSMFQGTRSMPPQPQSAQAPLSLLPTSIPQAMESFPDSTWDEIFLFHHYVTHAAVIMMPYEHPRNPWQSQYPATALALLSSGHKSMYSAMLSHAAFNVAHLRGLDTRMVRLGSKYYGEAIQELLHTIAGDNLDFPTTMASMMSLMFAELYSGSSGSWRHHFEGAWAWLKTHFHSEPWRSNDLACVSLQSLNIIKIIGDTSHKRVEEIIEPLNGPNAADSTAVAPIVSMSEFGFTIGAPRNVLECIERITEFRNKPTVEHPEGEVDCLLQDLLSRLDISGHEENSSCNFETESTTETLSTESTIIQRSPLAAQDQVDAFVNATYIYMYRSLLNVPPKTVRSYVKRTFSHVSAFFAVSGGNFSIWPAFIAAVEAYTEEDLVAARGWLSRATSFGVGSRNSITLVVEEVWRQREDISRASGMELGLIIIDWRSVMQELDCDLLLV
ncbi:fungal-specific transcription factor domain-containing protein [Dactylonectria estremocensis]|uniref:Fungal-specific transcription factor domain-containing protein n=1 Tax=Dactylonectria estremocensis TaxID=1079267 RepID=A0A9P9JCQ1_9HYPO|nr:fungal-specific transcription factor domain-containing protein [Dactylonectria estremocensis]